MGKKKNQGEEDLLENESSIHVATEEKAYNTSEENEEATEIEPQASSNEEVESLKQQVDDLKDKYLRIFSDFDNYRKRMMKEKVDIIKMAAQDTLSSLIPILDDFDRAKKAADLPDSKEKFSEGVELLYQKLYSVLKSQGLDPMDSTGKSFDSEYHEAITEIPAGTEEMKGKVIDTVEKGYMLKDKIIRHAKVVVGK